MLRQEPQVEYRLAAATTIEQLEAEVARLDKHHAEWAVLHQKEVDDTHRALRAKERECNELRNARDGAGHALAEYRALERDAARYRWLRERGAGIETPDDTYPDQTFDAWLGTTALDAAIDAAMRPPTAARDG